MTTALCEHHLEALDENALEEWLRLYMQQVHGLPCPPQRNGRSGQAQNGVDLMFRNSQGEWVGVQAKAYKRKRLTKNLMDAEVEAAHHFKPLLTHYIICTLNHRDASLLEHARQAQINGHANVGILFLQDLAEEASCRQVLIQDLIGRASPGYLEAMRQHLQKSPVPTLAVTSNDASSIEDPDLKAISAWIDVGNPQRSLDDLASYTGSALKVQCMIVEARARFALGELDAVAQVARDEGHQRTPSPVLLALGAYAAALMGDQESADAWLVQAMAIASEKEKPQVVGSYLRVLAERNGSGFDDLERFARDVLGDVSSVALPLADAAFQLGDLDTAILWYERARERQANWPHGARANDLGARVWKLIRAKGAGVSISAPLSECAAQISSMLLDRALQAPGLRLPLLINLGHARRTLGDFRGATDAWDEALALPLAPESLWMYRCALSAVEKAPLPSDELITLCAKSHAASLALASAYTMFGYTDRAEILIEAVLADAGASNDDRVRAHIEKIRIESAGHDDRVTPSHVAKMLSLVDGNNPSLPLFAWLIDNFQAAGADQGDSVRAALQDLAVRLPIDSMQRASLAEDLLRVRLDDIAISWLPDVEREAWPRRAGVTQLGGALALLQIYTRTFRFADARSLIGQLISQFPLDAMALLHCAHALYSAGDRIGAYGVLTDSIRRGVQEGSVIESWARLAVMLRRRREAHRILREIQFIPKNPKEYGRLLQARALLGIHGDEGVAVSTAARVTPDNAGVVFASGLLGRSSKSLRVAYGRIVRVRVTQDATVRMDEHILVQQEPGDSAPGVRALSTKLVPWVEELLGAAKGEVRTLRSSPFAGCNATILDVLGSDRWSVMQAAHLVHLLPAATTGVIAMSADDIEDLREHLSQRMNAQRLANDCAFRTASASGAAICIVATASNSSPRGLLRESLPWKPTGYPGSKEDIDAADQALRLAERFVLDPVTLLLMVELGAEAFLGSLPEKAVMTPQAAWQLFDWWYELERHQRGTAGYATTTANGELVMVPVTAERRRSVRAFWRRVSNAITQHVELREAPALNNPYLQKCIPVVGQPVITGMALAALHGWAYVTEEGMLSALAKHIANARVASLHRLFVLGAAQAWWRPAQAVMHIAMLVRYGWSWVSFPVSMVRTALRLPSAERKRAVETLLGSIKKADTSIAIRTLFALLRDIDKNLYPEVDSSWLRKLAVECLPLGLAPEMRARLVREFSRLHPGRIHRSSRRRLEKWAA